MKMNERPMSSLLLVDLAFIYIYIYFFKYPVWWQKLLVVPGVAVLPWATKTVLSPWLAADEGRVSYVLSHVVWWKRKKKFIYIYIYIYIYILTSHVHCRLLQIIRKNGNNNITFLLLKPYNYAQTSLYINIYIAEQSTENSALPYTLV